MTDKRLEPITYILAALWCVLRYGGHRYDMWVPLERGAHIRECRRCGWLHTHWGRR